MLTPEQIRKHSFRSAGKGLYRSEDVDAFLKEAAEACAKTQENAEELQKNNDGLYQRVEALANALNQMRAERELIQKTMILAQKAAEEITAKAQEESDRATGDARAEAARLRQESQDEASTLLRTTKAEMEKLLLETQAKAENIQAQAKARAESLFEEARGKAQAELVRISGETQRAQQALVQIRQETARFREDLLNAVARQMDLIEQMPDEEAGTRTHPAGRMEAAAEPAPQPQITLVKAPVEPAKEEKPAPEPVPEPIPIAQPIPAAEPVMEADAPPDPIPGQEAMFADLEAALDGSEEVGFRFVK